MLELRGMRLLSMISVRILIKSILIRTGRLMGSLEVIVIVVVLLLPVLPLVTLKEATVLLLLIVPISSLIVLPLSRRAS